MEEEYFIISEEEIDPNNPIKIAYKHNSTYLGPHSKNLDFLYITSRSIDLYPDLLRTRNYQREEQIIEIGAGLGGLIPFVAEKQYRNNGLRPIIIDPIDYSKIKTMLEKNLDSKKFLEQKKYIEVMIERCNSLEDSSKVRHIMKPFPKALEEDSSLEGIADIVVDQFASAHYLEGTFSNNLKDYDFRCMEVKKQIKRLFKSEIDFDKNLFSEIDMGLSMLNKIIAPRTKP